jgi:Fe2+ or Zn2+ uptake regulation protein
MAKKEKLSELPLALKTIMNSAEKKISASGLRLTEPRLALLRILITSDKPLKITELYALAKKTVKLDRVSAYRIISAFKKMGLVHSVGDGGFVFCTHFQEKEDHHLYLVCEDCDDVEEVNLPEKFRTTLHQQIQTFSKFKTHGSIQVTGSCLKCR